VLINSRPKLRRCGKKNHELEALIPREGEKAPRRWYSVLMIIMCLRLVVQAAIPLRAAPKAVHIVLADRAAVKDKPIPTHTTLKRWLAQVGLHKLQSPKKCADDWALLVDNSIQAGTQKCLVILGCRLSILEGRALTLEDMEVLGVELHSNCDADTVCKALERAQQRVGKVAMVCADDGPDLRRGVALFTAKHNVGRVFDVTHKIGTFLKKELESDREWLAFTVAAALAKKKMQQTEAAHLAPPNQRTKSRFLNIDVLTRWGIDVIAALNNPNHEDKVLLELYCSWVRQHEGLIERLKQFDLISRHAREHIRNQGLCSTSGESLLTLMTLITGPLDFHLAACQYAGQIIDFVSEQALMVPSGQIWIGTSEILESMFGKLKGLERDQSKGGFSSLVLGAVACVGKFDAETVSAAMAAVTTKDVEAWVKKEIGETFFSKRRKALGAARRGRIRKKIIPKQAGISEGEAMGF